MNQPLKKLSTLYREVNLRKKNNTILNIYYLGQHARAPDYKINCQQVAIVTHTNLQQSVCSHGKDYDSYYREL